MPMQATRTVPLFSAALRPDRSPKIMGGWVSLGVATVLATPLAVIVPEALIPIAVAFVGGVTAMSWLTWHQSRQRKVTQQLTLWTDQLEIVTRSGKGERLLKRFDPRTVRLVLHRDDYEKVVAMTLRHGEEAFEIGTFLSAEDKSSFAKAFGTALRRARHS
ncbi:MAG: DUF2244 domain-containing protein [Candidatus Devosia phytovorans]|uniref:DUF2244 domain-containing protein n=1 Tax=Candidatus Devosia phytovorans TaxID=3121372 RepID=A0AAJ5VSW0_9HYPH|nr:DUF2244 domain-containing protein [Devosia sp.]WEK04169.1 MAG: DUF2244 domain-containing protein [Devosia sp.]